MDLLWGQVGLLNIYSAPKNHTKQLWRISHTNLESIVIPFILHISTLDFQWLWPTDSSDGATTVSLVFPRSITCHLNFHEIPLVPQLENSLQQQRIAEVTSPFSVPGSSPQTHRQGRRSEEQSRCFRRLWLFRFLMFTLFSYALLWPIATDYNKT